MTLLSRACSVLSLRDDWIARARRPELWSLNTRDTAPACSLGVPSWSSSEWSLEWSRLLAAADLRIQQRALTKAAVSSVSTLEEGGLAVLTSTLVA